MSERTRSSKMRLRTLVLAHLAAIAAAWAMWRMGFLVGLIAAANVPLETALIALLAAYSAVGFLAIWRRRPDLALHVAGGLPMWGMACTVMGMFAAVYGLRGFDPQTLLGVFRGLVFSLLPNFFAVAMMAWLRELMRVAFARE